MPGFYVETEIVDGEFLAVALRQRPGLDGVLIPLARPFPSRRVSHDGAPLLPTSHSSASGRLSHGLRSPRPRRRCRNHNIEATTATIRSTSTTIRSPCRPCFPPISQTMPTSPSTECSQRRASGWSTLKSFGAVRVPQSSVGGTSASASARPAPARRGERTAAETRIPSSARNWASIARVASRWASRYSTPREVRGRISPCRSSSSRRPRRTHIRVGERRPCRRPGG